MDVSLCAKLSLPYLSNSAGIPSSPQACCFLAKDATSKLVTTLILSRLDYCNSLLSNISEDKLSRLQVVQNSAAKLVAKEKKDGPPFAYSVRAALAAGKRENLF